MWNETSPRKGGDVWLSGLRHYSHDRNVISSNAMNSRVTIEPLSKALNLKRSRDRLTQFCQKCRLLWKCQMMYT